MRMKKTVMEARMVRRSSCGDEVMRLDNLLHEEHRGG
jgi:hypothetical protein